MEARRDPASFRDPSGYVVEQDGRIFRVITEQASADYVFLRDQGILREFAAQGRLIESAELTQPLAEFPEPAPALVIEHPKLDLVSYPYEWTFEAWKQAALFHLDLHLDLLARGATLSDASAYNVQFAWTTPIFIDLLSCRPYREGEYWMGHQQFCEHFLNPLLLASAVGVMPNDWFRGRLDGIATEDLARLLPLRRAFSPTILQHVLLPAWLHTRARNKRRGTLPAKLAPLPKAAFQGLLRQLRRLVAGLEAHRAKRTDWQDYASTHSYSGADIEAKRRFVASFVSAVNPRLLLDLGCNTGDYSAMSLEHGARGVIAIDADHGAANAAFVRARTHDLRMQVLCLDLANESPNQGWNAAERRALRARLATDALLALALVHHLVVGRNIPLAEAIEWLLSCAPQGVIEFVPSDDAQVQRLSRFKPQILSRYTLEAFLAAIQDRAEIVRQETTPERRSVLVSYCRRSHEPAG